MEEETRNEDSGSRIPLIRFDSPWAWFYYATFVIQLAAATYSVAIHELAMVVQDSPFDTYAAILKSVSPQVAGMGAYSFTIAGIVEGLRMIAERYLAKRFAEGKKRGREEGREEGIAASERRLAEWLDANPAIKEAVESGEASPPPFLNGKRSD